jgi:hypothetical protein
MNLMISVVKSPLPPFAKGGRPFWLAIPSSFPLLQRGMEGDSYARGRQDFSVMNVYEAVIFCSRTVLVEALMHGAEKASAWN